MSLRCAIFASGTGSNARALLQAARELPQIEIEFVLSDRPQAPVLKMAQGLGFRTYLVERKRDQAEHEAGILKILEAHGVQWVFLAGYMRLLSSDFLSSFAKKNRGAAQVVNIHPSLLPDYPGAQALQRAFTDQRPTGVTLHLVDEGMDTGPILKQKKLPTVVGESFDSFSQRMHGLEHEMYVEFLRELALGKQVVVC